MAFGSFLGAALGIGVGLATGGVGFAALAAGGLGLAVGGQFDAAQQQKRATRFQREAQAQQQQQQERAQARERLRQLSEARRTRAAVRQSAANRGVLASSGAQGGLGSIQSQLGSNLSFLDAAGQTNRNISGLNRMTSGARSRASEFQALSGLGSTIFNLSFSPSDFVGSGNVQGPIQDMGDVTPAASRFFGQ